MKAAAFDYVRPRSLEEAIALFAASGGAAKLLAGGQSLGPMLNLRLARPPSLIDISRLPELRQIVDTGDQWTIGAAVTHTEIEDRAGGWRGVEALARIAGGIAYRSVRNRGTIGGSLAHADPAGDWAPVLAALAAVVVVRGVNGERQIAAEHVGQAAFTPALGEGELIVAVRVPKLSPTARFGSFKFCRKVGEFPEASAAVLHDPERRSARIFLGALDGPPQALPALAARLARQGAAGCSEPAMIEAIRSVGAFDAPELNMRAAVLRRALHEVSAT